MKHNKLFRIVYYTANIVYLPPWVNDVCIYVKLISILFQRFYLIGSNNTQTRFRVLKIDRTDPRELILVDDKVEYNKQEIHQLLNMIGFGNSRTGGRSTGINKLVSAFGIVGN